jgi:multidrug efflux pump subunit AcrA (membrane-fusion protein)
MKRMPPGRSESEEFERTDTMDVPALEDTGTLALPALQALPVDAADLAESLREHELRLEDAYRRITTLEADLLAAHQRCASLQRECDGLRAHIAQTPPLPEPPLPHAEVPGPPAAMERLERELAMLRRQNTRLHEALGSVQGQLAVREALVDEAEQALRNAQRKGAPPPDNGEWRVRCAELSAALQAEQAAALERGQQQEARLASLEVELDSLRARLILPPDPDADEEGMRPAQPRGMGNVLRVLVREDDGAEVVYPLGRHTSIGRTPDNDIQVDTTWVSRNHAAVLAGTQHCIIEDLNSTNGVLVNGMRVTRQVLHDGDAVTIGKTHFRYQQRT